MLSRASASNNEAHEAVRASLARLARQPSLSAFLIHVLEEFSSRIPQCDAQIFFYDAATDSLRAGPGAVGGQLLPEPAGLAAETPFAGPLPAHVTGAWKRLLEAGGRAIYFDLERDAADFWPGTREFHRELGHAGTLCCALLVGNRPLGMVGVGLQGGRPFAGHEIALVETLSTQAALAIEMDRLSREALAHNQAVEREAAAVARERQQHEANAALRRACGRLLSRGELTRFLDDLLREITVACNARSAAVFRYDAAAHTLRLTHFVREGRSLDPRTDPLLAIWRDPVDAGSSDGWAQMAMGKFFWMDLAQPPPELWEMSIPWHRAMGHHRIVTLGLFAGDHPLGFLGLGFADRLDRDEVQIAQVTALAQMAAAAMQVERLAGAAEAQARAEEREAAALARAAQLERTNEALQRTIDVLAGMTELHAFVPAVLQIVGQSFGAETCAFFEHATDETVILRYYLHEGRVCTPGEFFAVADDLRGFVSTMAAGFSVPEAYLGSSPRNRRRAVMLDHAAGTAVPEFDAFALSQGWDVELNVPLVVDGQAEAALVIYRGRDQHFSADEIALAETLGKQLALALQTARVAEQERAAAVAQERAAQLENTTRALQEAIDALTSLSRIEDFIPAVLGIVARTFGSRNCAVFEHREDVIFLRHFYIEGRTLTPAEFSQLRPAAGKTTRQIAEGFTVPDDYLGTPVRERTRAVVLDHVRGTAVPEFSAFALQNGWRQELNIPLLADGRADGALVIYRDDDRPFSTDEIALGETLAKQLSFALQTAHIAAAQRQTALEGQRADIAREIHDSLAQAFTGILLQIEAADLLQERGDPRWQSAWEKVQRLARVGLAEARRTALVLTPGALEGEGLLTVFLQLAQRSNVDGVLRCEFSYEGLPRPLPIAVERCLLRTAKEALSNATRHGRATEVGVHLRFAAGMVELRVADNGAGLPADGSPVPIGLGLRHLRESLAGFGGSYALHPGTNGGVVLVASIPDSSAERQIGTEN